MPDDTSARIAALDTSAEVAALKSGLGPFHGRILAALERCAVALEAIADVLEQANENPGVPVKRRKADSDA